MKDKIKKSAKEIKIELKKSLNTALVAAFGLIIALSWKDLLTEYFDSIVGISPVQGRLISALIITIISVIGILLVTKLFYVEEIK